MDFGTMRRLGTLPFSVYKYTVSPLLPAACRFTPTCSDYAKEAMETHGLLRGAGLAIRRIFRCHPFGANGFDPVPALHPAPCHPDCHMRTIPGHE